MNFSTLRLRPYQLEAQQAIVEARTRGFRAQLVSLATGLGKSVVIATLPDLLELRPGDVTLVVAHRDELIQQLVEKMTAQNPDAKVGVEKAEESAPDDSTIVVATVQTLTGPRLNRFVTKFGRRLALFVIDEAHHAAAPTYRAILDKILLKRPDALVIGFTATPHRGDGVRLSEIFPDMVYSMDARQAIGAGYLVPVRSYAIATETNLDEVASRGGDFVIGQLADAVDTDERNRKVVEAYQPLDARARRRWSSPPRSSTRATSPSSSSRPAYERPSRAAKRRRPNAKRSSPASAAATSTCWSTAASISRASTYRRSR